MKKQKTAKFTRTQDAPCGQGQGSSRGGGPMYARANSTAKNKVD